MFGSKINEFLNRILNEDSIVQTKELQGLKTNAFLNRNLNGVELSGCELQGPKINDFPTGFLEDIEI